ncbi:MAG: peptidoglycan D,D-transpeptidase FtsI family protein [Cellulomonadaceae bacterium]
MGALVLVLGAFGMRLGYLQVVAGPALAAESLKQRVITGEIPADRGEILDAEGTVLATSVERFHILVDQTKVAEWKRYEDNKVVGTGATAAAELLAPILGQSAPELAAELVGTSRGKYIAKNVLPDTWSAIRDLNIGWIGAERTTVREYPAGTVAGNLVGFVNSEGVGSAGLEQTMNAALTGEPGSYLTERGRRGHQIPSGAQSRTEAQAGLDVQTTIISDLQWKAQDAIEEQKAKTGATYGSIVISDVTTGEILALAETDTVNPGDLSASDPSTWGSRAVSNVFEPGSTAKVITMAAALETGVADPASQFVVPYQYTTPNGQVITDSHEHPTEQLTLAGIFADSSNTGTVQIGELMSTQVRYDYLTKFGFGSRTGIELPGESPGIVHAPDQWDGRTQYTVLFGQGLAVNAIQGNEVFATIGSGGVRHQAHLVSGYTAADGTTVPAEHDDPVTVVSPETAKAVLEMMETAVEEGTGAAAKIPGYRVAGKTGTAQAVNPATGRYEHYSAAFSGVVPVDNPRLAISVILQYPSLEYGGVVSAPVFSDVASFALQYLKVPPSTSEPAQYPTTWGESEDAQE